MAKEELTDKDVMCLGHLQRAFALLDRLHEVGCERDTAGNRRLHFDEYCKLVLLYIWNPLIESVHDLQQVLSLPKVAKAMGVTRFSAGSFSESVRVFEPEQLKAIITELAGELTPPARDPRLAELKDALTAVDGTVLTALSRLARAACGADARFNTGRDGMAMYGWRLHTQFDLQSFSAYRIDRTGARNAGENREHNVLRAHLEAGRCYVCDGGYADRSLFQDIADADSTYVIRAAENSVFELTEERVLSPEARKAGVVRDALVKLKPTPAAAAATTAPKKPHMARRVEVRVEPHPRRTRMGTKQTERIILYTNILDLPAEPVALIYRYRYTVELFFRTLKQLLGMRHLISQREEGIDTQVYCTLIVCLLIQLIAGKKPNKAMRNMVGWYLLGLAEAQDVLDFLNKPDNTGVKLRAKDELWKKLGVL